MEIKDRELIRLFHEEGKQNSAFRIIISRYSERLYWHIRRIVIFHEDADDVLQNTFIKVYKNLDKFEEKSSLFSWIYRIATNEALSYIKKNKKEYLHDPIDLVEHLESDPYFEGDEAYQRLIAATKQLPEKQSLVFQLKYFENMKYDEIAEILGGTVGSLKASYHHAVKKIESYLSED